MSGPGFVGKGWLKRFFDCGRAVRCMRRGRFLHLVVLYVYQGADRG